jgi:hypothetical protein
MEHVHNQNEFLKNKAPVLPEQLQAFFVGAVVPVIATT